MELLVKATKILAQVMLDALGSGKGTPPSSNGVHNETERRQNQGWYSRGQGWCPRGERGASLWADEIDKRQRTRDVRRGLVLESVRMASNGRAASDDE